MKKFMAIAVILLIAISACKKSDVTPSQPQTGTITIVNSTWPNHIVDFTGTHFIMVGHTDTTVNAYGVINLKTWYLVPGHNVVDTVPAIDTTFNVASGQNVKVNIRFWGGK